jgi:hypothetical protein
MDRPRQVDENCMNVGDSSKQINYQNLTEEGEEAGASSGSNFYSSKLQSNAVKVQDLVLNNLSVQTQNSVESMEAMNGNERLKNASKSEKVERLPNMFYELKLTNTSGSERGEGLPNISTKVKLPKSANKETQERLSDVSDEEELEYVIKRDRGKRLPNVSEIERGKRLPNNSIAERHQTVSNREREKKLPINIGEGLPNFSHEETHPNNFNDENLDVLTNISDEESEQRLPNEQRHPNAFDEESIDGHVSDEERRERVPSIFDDSTRNNADLIANIDKCQAQILSAKRSLITNLAFFYILLLPFSF